MKEEQKELYFFTKDRFSQELERITPTCVSPMIAIRQVVKKSIYQYVADYCERNAKAEDIFTQEDFQEVSQRLYKELIANE